jgi:hypothetical protein
MLIYRLYTTATGDSAMERRQIPLSDEPRPISEIFPVKEMFFRETPEGHVQMYHNAPRHQLIMITSGIIEIEVSNGQRYILKPGDLLLPDDFTGKGHITRSIRDVRGFTHIILKDDFDVSQWPIVQGSA